MGHPFFEWFNLLRVQKEIQVKLPRGLGKLQFTREYTISFGKTVKILNVFMTAPLVSGPPFMFFLDSRNLAKI